MFFGLDFGTSANTDEDRWRVVKKKTRFGKHEAVNESGNRISAFLWLSTKLGDYLNKKKKESVTGTCDEVTLVAGG